MKAVPAIRGNGFSPPFDSANMIPIADVEARGRPGSILSLLNTNPLTKGCRLYDLGISVPICVDISESSARLNKAQRIKITAFNKGTVDELLEACAKGNMNAEDFPMPGCEITKDRASYEQSRSRPKGNGQSVLDPEG